MMLTPPSSAFSPLEELEDWLVSCREMKKEYGGDPGMLADIEESEADALRGLRERAPERAAKFEQLAA
jgi:hypothetical protein